MRGVYKSLPSGTAGCAGSDLEALQTMKDALWKGAVVTMAACVGDNC